MLLSNWFMIKIHLIGCVATSWNFNCFHSMRFMFIHSVLLDNFYCILNIAQFHSDKICLLTQARHQRKMNEIEWFYELESFFHFRKKIEPKKSKKKSKSKPKDRHRLKVNL